MSEVNVYQQRRYLVANAMISTAIELLQQADPSLLEEINFDEILEVQACVAGLIDSRLRDDDKLVSDLLNNIDPDALTLSVDIVGTEFVGEWAEDNYWDSVRAGLDPETGEEVED